MRTAAYIVRYRTIKASFALATATRTGNRKSSGGAFGAGSATVFIIFAIFGSVPLAQKERIAVGSVGLLKKLTIGGIA
jgi:hypothetical protein